MKKFINDPFDFVEELTEGIIKAHGDYYRADKGDLRIIVRQDAPIKGKVAIATGGGSGHLPVFMGYVGKGLARWSLYRQCFFFSFCGPNETGDKGH